MVVGTWWVPRTSYLVGISLSTATGVCYVWGWDEGGWGGPTALWVGGWGGPTCFVGRVLGGGLSCLKHFLYFFFKVE